MLKEGTKIKIIDGGYGARDSNDHIGIVLNNINPNEFKTHGLWEYSDCIKVKLDNGEYWGISKDSEYEIINTYEEKTTNCIDVILEKLGLKLDEEFEILINSRWHKCKILNDGLKNITFGGSDWRYTFNSLITGQFTYRKIKPILKPTEEEQEYLDAAKKLGFNWVAKDKNEKIDFFKQKPVKCEDYWDFSSDDEYYGENLKSPIDFKFISWEDKKPYKIK
jgi:hypothetical protein